MSRAERLPLEREQAMALEIAEGAVVGEDVEAVAACARTRGPACGGGSRARRRRRGAARRGRRPTSVARSRAADRRAARDGVERRGDDLDLAVGIEVGERDLVARLGGRSPSTNGSRGRVERRAACRRNTRSSGRRGPADRRARGTPGSPGAAREHLLRAVADLVERVREHAQQQRFERLAGAEQADVGRRRRRQQAAQRVERLGADHRSVDGVGILRRLRVLRAEVRFHRRDPARVGLEREVERARRTRRAAASRRASAGT